MSESEMVTEREAVIRERRAFVAGSQFEDEAWREMLRVNHSSGADCIAASRRFYPLPTVKRPRVVVEASGAIMWRVEGDKVLGCCLPAMTVGGHATFGNMSVQPTRERVKLWADLLANPTELVEDTA